MYYPGGTTEPQILQTTINNLEQGLGYALTFWSAGTVADVYVMKNADDTNPVEYEIINSSGDEYEFHTVLFTALNSNGNMRIEFHFKIDDPNSYPLYLDEINVLPIVAGGNFGFESDDLNWERAIGWWPYPDNNVDIISPTSPPPPEGEKCAYYDGQSAAYNQFYTYIAGLRIGEQYTLVFQAAGNSADCWVGPMSDVYAGYYVTAIGDGSETNWIQQTLIFTATETTMLLWFDFYPNTPLRVDDFHVIQHSESGKLLINEVNNSNPVTGPYYVELYNSTENNILLLDMQMEVYKDSLILPDAIFDFPDDFMPSQSYIVVTNDNAAFQNLYGSSADYEFPGLDLSNLDGLIIRQTSLGIVDQFNDVPQPNDTLVSINDDHLYLRKGYDIENGGANLAQHWCDAGANRIGTPGATNKLIWNPDGSDGNWDTDGNWDPPFKPCECTDVEIGPGTNQPVITSMDARARNLNVQSGASVTINGKLEIVDDEQ